MNKLFLAGFLAALMAGGLPLRAAPNQVQITMDKSRESLAKSEGAPAGKQSKGAEKVSYEFKLQNVSFNDLADLTVDYVVFIERQRLGEKKGTEVVVRVTGSKPVPALTRKEPQTVKTEDIELRKENLVGEFHYLNGGRIKAEDSVKGVWVRVSHGGTIIGELANPPTVVNRGWDKK